ncbi:hypothetical protein M0802_011362 [Mischocyttarus mexicanus]|nr:hypothetical protein M0802_011362 [Mischocyttarus mexicanus]
MEAEKLGVAPTFKCETADPDKTHTITLLGVTTQSKRKASPSSLQSVAGPYFHTLQIEKQDPRKPRKRLLHHRNTAMHENLAHPSPSHHHKTLPIPANSIWTARTTHLLFVHTTCLVTIPSVLAYTSTTFFFNISDATVPLLITANILLSATILLSLPSLTSSYDSDEPNPCAVPRSAHSSSLLKVVYSKDCLSNRKDNLVIFISRQGKSTERVP